MATKRLGTEEVVVTQDIDTSILEETDTAFDPRRMQLDLTKDEKRRTTALMLAIQAYTELIVKDTAMYTAMVTTGKQMKEASVNAIVLAAVDFDAFIETGHSREPLVDATSRKDD